MGRSPATPPHFLPGVYEGVRVHESVVVCTVAAHMTAHVARQMHMQALGHTHAPMCQTCMAPCLNTRICVIHTSTDVRTHTNTLKHSKAYKHTKAFTQTQIKTDTPMLCYAMLC